MSPVRVLLFWALLFALLAPPSEARADSSYSVAATRLAEGDKIRVDGKLDEAAWQKAPVVTNWHQTRINVGKRAEDETVVRILYDRDNLYFGFHCKDSQPNKITAYTVQNEGFLHQEDNVTVILDTFLDHRNAYYFWTNALGVRTDGRIVDDGEAFSTDWQGEWESMGSIVKDGWIAEMRIPFSNFQYENVPEHTFGMLLDREHGRLEEWSNWTPDGVNSAKVSRYPHLTGLKDIAPRSMIGITGYVGGALHMPERGNVSFFPNAGVDVRFSPFNWGSLKLTVNPDYSQVNIDQDVLWLNPEERQLPERRPFFLEGGDLFIAPLPLFYSRRIAPRADDRVWAGVQAVGKKDGLGFSVMHVLSEEHLSAGSKRTELVNSTVARFQKDIGKRSAVNALGLSRLGDTQAGVVSADINLNVAEEIFVTGQIAKSTGRKPDEGSEAFQAGIHRFDTTSEVWLQYEDIGKNFDTPLGYIPILDKRSVYAHGYYNWYTKKDFLPRVDITYDDLWRTNHAGQETRHYRRINVQPYLNHDLAFYLDARFDRTGGYENNIGTFGFSLLPNDWQNFQFTTLGGSYLGGNFLGLNGQLNLKLGPHIAIKMNGFYTLSWDLPPGSPLLLLRNDGYQWAFYGQVRYQFSPDLYARLTFQQGDAFGITDLNAVSGRVIDAVIGWHYRLGSDAFLVYTQQPFNSTQEHRVLAKASLYY